MPLDPAEKRLAATVDFDEVVCERAKHISEGPLSRLITFTKEFKPVVANAVAVIVTRDKAASVVAKLQPEIGPRGYRAFWSEQYNLKGNILGNAVAVLKVIDDLEIIRLRQTNGANYGISTDVLLRKLEAWRQRCEFQVVGASATWAAIQFKTLPRDICIFAEEIYDFCPDTVEQDVGLRNESDYPEFFETARRLCPKLSPEMERKLQEKKARIEAMASKVPPQVRVMIESSGFKTPTDMGIRLLAFQLRESHQLFLWWD